MPKSFDLRPKIRALEKEASTIMAPDQLHSILNLFIAARDQYCLVLQRRATERNFGEGFGCGSRIRAKAARIGPGIRFDNSITWRQQPACPRHPYQHTGFAGTTGFTPSSATSGAVTLAGTLNPANGGTGANTLTGYVKGTGVTAMTASATVPTPDLSGTVTNAQLSNSSLTVGTTNIVLGATASTLGGLISVAVPPGTPLPSN
jgi:hypothetical protein